MKDLKCLKNLHTINIVRAEIVYNPDISQAVALVFLRSHYKSYTGANVINKFKSIIAMQC